MSNWLANPDDKPSRRDRAFNAAVEEVMKTVRLSGLKVDGVVALSDHIVQRLDALDDDVVMLAGNDERKARIFAEIEMTAIVQSKAIQRQLNSPWEL